MHHSCFLTFTFRSSPESGQRAGTADSSRTGTTIALYANSQAALDRCIFVCLRFDRHLRLRPVYLLARSLALNHTCALPGLQPIRTFRHFALSVQLHRYFSSSNHNVWRKCSIALHGTQCQVMGCRPGRWPAQRGQGKGRRDPGCRTTLSKTHEQRRRTRRRRPERCWTQWARRRQPLLELGRRSGHRCGTSETVARSHRQERLQTLRGRCEEGATGPQRSWLPSAVAGAAVVHRTREFGRLMCCPFLAANRNAKPMSTWPRWVYSFCGHLRVMLMYRSHSSPSRQSDTMKWFGCTRRCMWKGTKPPSSATHRLTT